MPRITLIVGLLLATCSPALAVTIEVPMMGNGSSQRVAGTYVDNGITYSYSAGASRQFIMGGAPTFTIGILLFIQIEYSGTLAANSQSYFPITGPRFGNTPGHYADGQSGVECSIVGGCTESSGPTERVFNQRGDVTFGNYWGEMFSITIGNDEYEFVTTPEPGTFILVAVGMLGLARRSRASAFRNESRA